MFCDCIQLVFGKHSLSACDPGQDIRRGKGIYKHQISAKIDEPFLLGGEIPVKALCGSEHLQTVCAAEGHGHGQIPLHILVGNILSGFGLSLVWGEKIKKSHILSLVFWVCGLVRVLNTAGSLHAGLSVSGPQGARIPKSTFLSPKETGRIEVGLNILRVVCA